MTHDPTAKDKVMYAVEKLLGSTRYCSHCGVLMYCADTYDRKGLSDRHYADCSFRVVIEAALSATESEGA